ncbi:hypothetical protein EAG_11133 [Camponotus floridanus]|uniref:Uncharacterized protein n=1 Tax=Camponotus floridanus TaxID=104421 RepID=E2A884_CAMFO|nr:hypothetical protein EAG_11133 [Camponotus floridanus]
MGQKTEDGRENHQHTHEKITKPPLANEVSSLLGEDEERKIHRLGRWKEKSSICELRLAGCSRKEKKENSWSLSYFTPSYDTANTAPPLLPLLSSLSNPQPASSTFLRRL